MAFSEPHCPQNEFFIFVSCNFLVIELNQIGAGMSRKTLRSLQILSQCTNFVIFIAIQKFISPQYFHNSHNILAPNCVLARFGLCRCIRENEFLSCISVIFSCCFDKKRASVWARVCYYGKGIIDCLLLYKVYQCCHKCKQAEKLLTVFAQTFICD